MFISAAAILLAFSLFGVPFAFVAAVVFYVIHFFYKRNIYLDFDYALTNGELDIAKVLGGEKRKHLLTVNCRESLECLAPLNSDEIKHYEDMRLKTYDCTSLDEKAAVYCLIAKAEGDNGEKIRLYFEPSRDMLREFHRISPRNVKIIDNV